MKCHQCGKIKPSVWHNKSTGQDLCTSCFHDFVFSNFRLKTDKKEKEIANKFKVKP